jgi:hypothetical protein
MLSRYTWQISQHPDTWEHKFTVGGEDLEWTLRAHARVIQVASPNDDVRAILENALAESLAKLGIADFDTGSEGRWLRKAPTRFETPALFLNLLRGRHMALG